MGFVASSLVHAELLQVNPLYTDASSSQLDTLAGLLYTVKY